jgi:Putative prokaryotic signal transducing protein
MTDAQGPVVVASFVGIGEAEVARGMLESEGIGALLGNQHLVSMFWHYSQATGGIRLMVASEDADRARQLLGVHESVLEPVDEDTRSPGDVMIERAWKSTIIGFIGMPPALHLWALWLLKGAYAAGGPRTDRGRKLAARTVLVSGCMVALSAAVLLRVVLQ